MLFFFHFGQANWPNVVSLGFGQRYIEGLDFALKVRMVTALAFKSAKNLQGISGGQHDYARGISGFPEVLEKTYLGMPKVVSNPGETLPRLP